jgi:hypothetical protein
MNRKLSDTEKSRFDRQIKMLNRSANALQKWRESNKKSDEQIDYKDYQKEKGE